MRSQPDPYREHRNVNLIQISFCRSQAGWFNAVQMPAHFQRHRDASAGKLKPRKFLGRQTAQIGCHCHVGATVEKAEEHHASQFVLLPIVSEATHIPLMI
jgi:hypothetical protein